MVKKKVTKRGMEGDDHPTPNENQIVEALGRRVVEGDSKARF